jgi:hypothetical protein
MRTLLILSTTVLWSSTAHAGLKSKIKEAFQGSAIEQAERNIKRHEKALDKQIRTDAKNDNLEERRNAKLERKEHLIKARNEMLGSSKGTTLERAQNASAAYERAEESARNELETYQNSLDRGSKGVFGSVKQKLKEAKVQKAQERLDKISAEREKANHIVDRIDSHNSKKDNHESSRSPRQSSDGDAGHPTLTDSPSSGHTH